MRVVRSTSARQLDWADVMLVEAAVKGLYAMVVTNARYATT
jgi:hypothetical protein